MSDHFTTRPLRVRAWLIRHGAERPAWVLREFEAGYLDWCPSGDGLFVSSSSGTGTYPHGSWLVRSPNGRLAVWAAKEFTAAFAPANPEPTDAHARWCSRLADGAQWRRVDGRVVTGGPWALFRPSQPLLEALEAFELVTWPPGLPCQLTKAGAALARGYVGKVRRSHTSKSIGLPRPGRG